MAGTPYSGMIGRSLTDILGDSVSVLSYGAVGDGVTDDGPAFRLAISRLAAVNGRALYVPGGRTYLIKTPITFPTGDLGITIVGDGESTIIKRGATMPSGYGVFTLSGCSSVSFQFFSFDGNVTTSVGKQYGTMIGENAGDDPMFSDLVANTSFWVKEGCSDIEWFGVSIRHTGGYSAILDARFGNVRNISFDSCLLENNRPFLFGSSPGDLNYGSWVGGILAQGDCRNATGRLYGVKGLKVVNSVFRRMNGNCIWSHSYGFDSHHEDFVIVGNRAEAIARDFTMIGNVKGGVVQGNTCRKVGYRTTTDNDSPTPAYLTDHYAVAYDNAGLVEGVNITNNVAIDIVGGGIDLDGYYGAVVANNTISGLSGQAVKILKGLQTGETYLGTRDSLLISGNHFTNCWHGAIVLKDAENCLVEGNSIDHPVDATYVPILLFSGNLTTKNNTVRSNFIRYDGANFCVAEMDVAGVGFDASCVNLVYDNTLLGTNLGEFYKNPNSGSRTGIRLSTNDTNLTQLNESFLQREGKGSSSALKIYDKVGGTTQQLIQIQRVNGLLNVSIDGAAQTGIVATANRTTLGFGDAVFTGKLMSDAFIACFDHANGAGSYIGSHADALDDNWALLRYNRSQGRWEQSVSTSAGARVWNPLGGTSEWLLAGSDLYYTAGGVMIGTNTTLLAGFKLQVVCPDTLGMLVHNSGATTPAGGAGMQTYAVTPTGEHRLGFITFGAKNGASLVNALAISGVAHGAWTPGVDHGAYLRFETTPIGSTTRAERMRILGDGTVWINRITDDGTGAKLQVAGYISANAGFYTSHNVFNAIQAPNGGFYGKTVTVDSIEAAINLSRDAGNYQYLRFTTGPTSRWAFGITGDAEGGSNAGSNFFLNAYNDAGGFLGTPIFVNRQTGSIIFRGQGVTVVSNGSPPQLWVGENGATQPRLYLNASTGTDKLIGFASNGYTRWAVGVDGAAESGGNVGTTFVLHRYDDSGTYLSTPVVINRATGEITLSGNVTLPQSGQALTISNGYINSVGGYYTNNSNQLAIHAQSGGVTALWLIGKRSLTLLEDTKENAGLSSPGQGRFLFDIVTKKFVVSENGGNWVNLVGGSLSGLTAGRIPYTTGASSLADTANLQWDNNAGLLKVLGLSRFGADVDQGATVSVNGSLYAVGTNAAAIQFIVKGMPLQTGNLFEARDSAGVSLFALDPLGVAYIRNDPSADSTFFGSYGSRAIRFRQNVGDSLYAGNVAYRPSYGTDALTLVGAGTGNSGRLVLIYDALMAYGNTLPGLSAANQFRLAAVSGDGRPTLSYNGSAYYDLVLAENTFASGRIAFGSAGNRIQGSSVFIWDAVSGRLGVNKSVPGVTLHVGGQGYFDGAAFGAGLTVADGYIDSTEGYYTPIASDEAFKAIFGGLAARSVNIYHSPGGGAYTTVINSAREANFTLIRVSNNTMINALGQFVGFGVDMAESYGVGAGGFNCKAGGSTYNGQTLTSLVIVTDVRDNGGVLEKKTRTIDVRGGVITSISSESAWT